MENPSRKSYKIYLNVSHITASLYLKLRFQKKNIFSKGKNRLFLRWFCMEWILNYWLLSKTLGSRSRPTTLSISSCAFRCTSGYLTMYNIANSMELAVVSSPPNSKSTHVTVNWSSSKVYIQIKLGNFTIRTFDTTHAGISQLNINILHLYLLSKI